MDAIKNEEKTDSVMWIRQELMIYPNLATSASSGYFSWTHFDSGIFNSFTTFLRVFNTCTFPNWNKFSG